MPFCVNLATSPIFLTGHSFVSFGGEWWTGDMRTDNGTFVFKIPALLGGARVTISNEYSSGSVTFYLFPRPGEDASLQLSGLLLEAETDLSQKQVLKIWQSVDEETIKKRWERDPRCTRCDEEREPFSPLCRACVRDGVSP